MKKILGLIVFLLVFLFGGVLQVNAIALQTLRIEESVEPGSQIATTIRLFNDQQSEVVLYPTVEGFTDSGDESGNPTFVPVDKDVNDLPNWILFNSETYTLAPGEKIDIPIVIEVPKNAEPGGHYATIFFKTVPSGNENGTVQLGMNIGTLVILDVKGDVYENVSLLSFKTLGDQKHYNHLPVVFETRLKNEGNVHVKPTGIIKIKNIFGLTSDEIKFNSQDGNILPKTIRKYIDVWVKDEDAAYNYEQRLKNSEDSGNFFTRLKDEWNNFAIGRYKAVLSIDVGRSEPNIITAEYVFWVWPWRVMFISIIILMIVILLLRLYHQSLLNAAYKRAKADLENKKKKE